ncbi:RNA polymerase sigma factor [Hyphococcus sp.]|uniref:RNA polymerase sigma factor n=1 Tax=Hyphococcus sp. TaxID=2038636 RepID=UPI003D0C5DA1
MSYDALIAEMPRMREYARYLARDHVAADDLVQDSLSRAMVAIDGRDSDKSLRAWLFSIMRNRHIDIVRRKAAAPDGVELDTIEHAMPAQEDGATDFLIDLSNAFDTLPDELKETMWLVGLQGYSYEEAATVMAIPIGTVRSRVFRARALLRNSMAAYFPRVDDNGEENA